MNTIFKPVLQTFIFLSVSACASAGGQGSPTQSEVKGPEQREQMATIHEKMAQCLRSKDKSIEECHREMMNSCHALKTESGCAGMGSMMMNGARGMKKSASPQNK